MQTRHSDMLRPAKKNNPYRDDYGLDRIELKRIVGDIVGLEELPASEVIDILDDQDKKWYHDRSKPKVENGDKQQQSYEQELTKLCVSDWLDKMTSGPKETSVTHQDIDCESRKYNKVDKNELSWAAQEEQLLIPASSFSLISGMPSIGRRGFF